MRNIANIINFARGCEPRSDDDSFLLPTLQKELELCRRYGFPNTALLQFDALVTPAYPALVKEYGAEPGLWLEVVRPLCSAAGIPWRGRYDWDWDIRVNFLSAYPPEQRRKLIDAAFGTFRDLFGAYPRVAGCWSVDADSLAYIENTYGLDAFCICKDQYGTDGITVWGGYYTGGYYPSRRNAVLPARERENQIGIPVFRMLGPDPITQYDLGLGSPEERQSVCSLEPVCKDGGGDPDWVDWFLRENYNGKALSHAYAQFGQENSFGWEQISPGLPMQLQKLRALADAGKVCVQTLGETGRWYKQTYALSPCNSCCFDSDSDGRGRKTLWYYSRYYRVNVLFENNRAWIRDLQLYTDAYAEPYLAANNTDTRCGTFALPVTDGFRFSSGGVRAGIYPEAPGCADFRTLVSGPGRAAAVWGDVTFTAEETRLSVASPAPGFRLRFRYGDVPALPYREVTGTTLFLTFRDFTGAAFDYELRLSAGAFVKTEQGIDVLADKNGRITFDLAPAD